MANTHKKIQTVTVGAGGASSIEFTSIPQTYTDLVVKLSIRDDTSANGKDYKIELNGSTTSYTYRRIYGDSSAVYSDSASTSQSLTINSATSTASTFANCEIYIPNYTSTNYKSWSTDTVSEKNATAANSSYTNLYSGLWSNTAAITSIAIKPTSGTPTIQQYTTATLYGVFNTNVSGAPSAPTSVTATNSGIGGAVSVAFTPAGQTASLYTVTSTPGSFTATGTSSPITVSGLTNGTAYTFTVTAANPLGSATSVASSAVTPSIVPGGAWVARTMPSSAEWSGVTYGGSTFVAVTADSSGTAATSSDGVTWNSRTMSARGWKGVTYGNGYFVACSFAGTNAVQRSTDGITWDSYTPPNNYWIGIAYGGGTFTMVANNSSTAATSTNNGATWTSRTLPSYQYWYAITYGGGTFVAVSYYNNAAATSSDGVTWTARTLPTGNYANVGYGNGIFVAPSTTNDGVVAVSTDNGVNWTQRALPTSIYWGPVAYGNGTFTVLSVNSGNAATSSDGITWTARTAPTASWSSVVYGGSTFVAVSGGPSSTSATSI